MALCWIFDTGAKRWDTYKFAASSDSAFFLQCIAVAAVIFSLASAASSQATATAPTVAPFDDLK